MNRHFLSKRIMHMLGFAGVCPSIALMFGCWAVHPDWLGDFVKGQLAYSIVILSFLGGTHWGATMASADLSAARTRKALLWGIIPPLVACAATLAGGYGFAVLMAGFAVAYRVDKRLFTWYRFPDWCIRLRFILTCTVVAALALTVLGANVRG